MPKYEYDFLLRREYVSATLHFTPEQHGANLRLFMSFWNSLDLSIPNDDRQLAIIVGMSRSRWKKMKGIILPFWVECEEGRLVPRDLSDDGDDDDGDDDGGGGKRHTPSVPHESVLEKQYPLAAHTANDDRLMRVRARDRERKRRYRQQRKEQTASANLNKSARDFVRENEGVSHLMSHVADGTCPTLSHPQEGRKLSPLMARFVAEGAIKWHGNPINSAISATSSPSTGVDVSHPVPQEKWDMSHLSHSKNEEMSHVADGTCPTLSHELSHFVPPVPRDSVAQSFPLPYGSLSPLPQKDIKNPFLSYSPSPNPHPPLQSSKTFGFIGLEPQKIQSANGSQSESSCPQDEAKHEIPGESEELQELNSNHCKQSEYEVATIPEYEIAIIPDKTIKQPAHLQNETKQSKRATRIPDDWKLDYEGWNFASDKGYSREQISSMEDHFRDYWMAKSGSGATWKDWNLVWKNWVRNDIKFSGGPNKQRRNQNGLRPLDEVASDMIKKMRNGTLEPHLAEMWKPRMTRDELIFGRKT